MERGEHLRMAACPLTLLLHLLACTRLDDIRMCACDEEALYFLRAFVGEAEHPIGVRRPNDIPLRRLIRQQRRKQALRIQPQYFILYPNEQGTPPFIISSFLFYFITRTTSIARTN